MVRRSHIAVAATVVSLGAVAAPSASVNTSALPDRALARSTATRAAAPALRGLRFERNRGQVDPRVLYLARAGDTTVYLTLRGAVVGLAASSETDAKGAALRVRFAGGAAEPTVTASKRLPGVSNYLIGDPSKWRVGIPSFGRVRYDDVYPGIDVVFHDDAAGGLEYDMVVAPGADPAIVRLAFRGAGSMRLGPQGALLLGMPDGVLRQEAPAIYQRVAGARRIIQGGFVLGERGQVQVRVGAYDSNRPLVIDPVISYSTYVGGEHSELANAVAVDANGSAFVTGQTDSVMFPTRNAFDPTFGGGTCGFGFPCRDTFVTKLNPSGSDVVYSTYLGGRSDDIGRGIAVDDNGNAYVTGNTASPNFPVLNAFQPSFGGGSCTEIGCTGDAFVTKLSIDGATLVYSTYLGGAGNDQGNGIALNASGLAHVAGVTTSADFPIANAFQPLLAGLRDGFVTKMAADGSALEYSTFLGGQETGFDRREGADAVAVGSRGSAYVTGETTAPDFPTRNALQDRCAGNCVRADAYVTRFSPGGGRIVYSTYLGGFTDEGSMGHDQGLGIAVDRTGAAFVTGFTSSRDFPVTPGVFQPAFAGGDDGVGGDSFVTSFSPRGSSLRYSTYLGGRHDDTGLAMDLDAAGRAYLAGYTDSDNFPTRKPLQTDLLGDADAFVTRLNADGTALGFSTYLGGSQGDVIEFTVGTGIAVGTTGAYVGGWTNTRDFPIRGGFQETLQGEYDTFVTKIAP